SHPSDVAGTEEEHLTLLESFWLSDVADVYVGHAIIIQVGKVHAHAFERVASKHIGFRRCKLSPAFQQSKTNLSACRSIPKKTIWSKVMRDIQLRQQVAIEITGAHCETPSSADTVWKGVSYFFISHTWIVTRSGRCPTVDPLASAVKGMRERLRHRDAAITSWVIQI